MKRGEIWTAAGGKDYAGKPRPVVIVQDDSFDATESVTVCGFTSDPTDAPFARITVEPSEEFTPSLDNTVSEIGPARREHGRYFFW